MGKKERSTLAIDHEGVCFRDGRIANLRPKRVCGAGPIPTDAGFPICASGGRALRWVKNLWTFLRGSCARHARRLRHEPLLSSRAHAHQTKCFSGVRRATTRLVRDESGRDVNGTDGCGEHTARQRALSVETLRRDRLDAGTSAQIRLTIE